MRIPGRTGLGMIVDDSWDTASQLPVIPSLLGI
jgi:hypothetical protein